MRIRSWKALGLATVCACICAVPVGAAPSRRRVDAGVLDAGAPITPASTVSKPTVLLMSFEANKIVGEQAPGLTALLLTRFKAAPELTVIAQTDVQRQLSLERQKQVLGIDWALVAEGSIDFVRAFIVEPPLMAGATGWTGVNFGLSLGGVYRF